MKRYTVEDTFTMYMEDGDEVTATLHYIDFDNSDARDEYVGFASISIEGSETYQETEFYIWGNGESEESSIKDFSGCYLCLPTLLEEPDEDEGEEDELDIVHFDDFVGMFNINL